jgi:hypothetical protein
MPVSSYLFNEFDEEELALILAIHNDLSDNNNISLDTLKCMKFDHFLNKIIAAKEKSNTEGTNKINIILHKIDTYIKQ